MHFYHVPGTVLDTGSTIVKTKMKKQKENQTKPSLHSHGVTVKWGIQSTNELCNMLDEWSED